MKTIYALIAALLWSCAVLGAEEMSPVGLWQTFGEANGKPKSLIEISLNNGALQGKILELYEPEVANPVCDKCDGDKKNQPIIGLAFLWGLKPDGARWRDGHILDPENGKVYSASAELKAQGQQLEVRGFIGFSFVGRSQIWQRYQP
ncbi:DUF2147 domain-containing protein [Simiduia curdlanivorans]|uniref:DUF2147 domain-containing protein n=1 Tax=Simiduia curdlanivorans TaxID=1492769 RepID=A0ABV8V1P2_9GAMM|nr:DUF2147 domain-containing protein [Simiduia curdlanivorans]MDN3637850.1 DUF2147 domain-containing protein [Simiduia curdlanivorans]